MNKHTRKALFASVLSLILCVSMLIGTTFAWFTDTVTTGVNTIQSGTLDVELADENGATLGDILYFRNAKNETDILWEPGASFKLDEFQILNKGNLALKYQVVISGVADGDAKLLEAIDFTVSITDETGTTEVGTFAQWAESVAHNEILPGKSSGVISVIGTMKEEAGNEYQDLTIDGVAITVLATQATEEVDMTDDQYDAGAEYPTSPIVTTAEELYDAVAVASGDATIIIDGDIVMNRHLSKAGLNSIKFVALNDDASISQGLSHMFFNGAKVTFEGLTLTHAGKPYQGNGGQAAQSFVVWEAEEVNYIDCTFDRSVGTLHASVHNFIGCTFNGVYNPDNALSEYPLHNYDSEETNVIDCTFNCTNRGAILFFGDNLSGEYTLNVSNTSFLGDIIADKTAVEIHSRGTCVYNVNIDNVIVGSGIVNGLYRIKPANEGTVNVNVDTDTIMTNVTVHEVGSASDLAAFADATLSGNSIINLTSDIDMSGKVFQAIAVSSNGADDTLTFNGNGYTISNITFDAATHNGNFYSYGMFYTYSGNTVIVNDLTVDGAVINAPANNYGAAVIVGINEGTSILNNVDVINSSITNSYDEAAVFVSYNTGSITMTDCDTTGCTVVGEVDEDDKTSVGIGHNNESGVAVLTNCTKDITTDGWCDRNDGSLTVK